MKERKVFDYATLKALVDKGYTHDMIAEAMGYSRSYTTSILIKHGLKSKRLWTEEEINYLEKNWGKSSVAWIAKKLNREYDAIKAKAYKLELGNYLNNSEFITAAELSKATNYDNTSVRWWIEKMGLKAKKVKIGKGKKRFYRIKIDDFWEFAKEYDNLDLTRFEDNVLAPEPLWATKRRKEQFKNKRTISSYDKFKIKQMYEDGKTYKAIVEATGISRGKVERIVKSMNLTKRQIQITWKEEEIKTLVDMLMKGHSYDDIAYELGREKDQVRMKRYDLIKRNIFVLEG